MEMALVRALDSLQAGRMSDPKQLVSASEIAEAGLTDWRHEGATLRARFDTRSFATGLDLVHRIGESAEADGHHPDVTLTYPSVDVTLTSHDVGGITSRDVALARAISDHAAGLGVGGAAQRGGEPAAAYTQGFSGFAVPDVAAAKSFCADVLGLEATEEQGMLQLALPGGATVLAYPKEDHRPAAFTILNLGVADLPAAVDELTARGATWLRYEGFDQDERGIARGGEHGPDIAWTSDPAGSIVAVMQLETN